MSEYRLKHYKGFDKGYATEYEYYTLERLKRFLWWSWWSEEGYYTEVGVIRYTGDKKWAQKIAKHLVIEMPSDSPDEVQPNE